MTEAAIDRQFEWDESQQTAIDLCCNMQMRIAAVTGVAGTGKTTIIREVYTTLRNAGYSVVLCAPTGKAAKRIQEATGIPAMTIHRLLEYPHPGERDPDTGKALMSTEPKRDRNNPLAQQVVIADEYAMVNRTVHRNLIDALPPGGRLCMFGDVNQLKPIEQGKLAGQESSFEAALRRFEPKGQAVRLERIHRTTEGSGIALNGERILKGQVPTRKQDFIMKITEQPVRALEEIVMDALEAGINYGSNDGQIISCTKKSWIGTYKLNILLQGLLNYQPQTDTISLPRNKWDKEMPIRVGIGDKVIWTENAYDLRDPWDQYEGELYIPTPPDKIIMNGESGVILSFTDEGGIEIDLGDRIVNVPHEQTKEDSRGHLYPTDPRKTIDLGYCITTHKAQGSEWQHVVHVLNKSTSFMQSRHNLYTAISRARKTATLIADQRSLQNAVFQTMSAMERKEAQGR